MERKTVQLTDLAERKGLRAAATMIDKTPPDCFSSGASSWRVRLSYQGRALRVNFYTGSGITHYPTAADVVSCLISDADAGSESFKEFCSSFGYDTDSRKAERCWRACRKMSPKVRKLLGDDFEEFARAEH
jgi:hypothetical protein